MGNELANGREYFNTMMVFVYNGKYKITDKKACNINVRKIYTNVLKRFINLSILLLGRERNK